MDSTSKMKLAAQIVPQAHAVLRSAGIYSEPSANTQSIGYDTNGKALYADRGLLQSQDPTLGTKHTQTFASVLDPFGVLSEGDHSSLDKIGTIASDTAFAAQLAALQQAGDKKGFITTVLNKFQQPITNSITSDPKAQDGIGASFTAWNLYNNWEKMSPAQKSLGLANFGIQTYKTASGTNLAAKNIVDPTASTPGLNVGQALGMFSAGTNAYSLAKNWNQYNTLQKIAGGTSTTAELANLGKSFGMLGNGTAGSAANVTAQQISQAGWQSAPHLGIGAVTGDAGAQALPGYKTIGQVGGKMVAAPASNAPVTESTLSKGAGFIGDAASVAGIALGAQAVYKGWGEGGKAGAINGALGGAAMSGGLYALGASNPYLLGAVVAASVAGDTIKTGRAGQRGIAAANLANPLVAANPAVLLTNLGKELLAPFKSGKSTDQQGRDWARKNFANLGAVDKNFDFSLADGSKANIGVDGKDGYHAVTDPSKLTDAHKGIDRLNAWDSDYTNNLDYTAALGGVTLSRLVSGGRNTPVDQVGNQVGNAALSNIGYGKDFSQGNFTTLTSNLKAMYAQSGIKSKSDGYQLANQAYAEGRLNDSDHMAALNSLNMTFDQNGYDTAQKLMAGRFQGISVAAKSDPVVSTVKPNTSTVSLKPTADVSVQNTANPGSSFLRSKNDVVAANKSRFGNVGQGAANA